MLVLSDPAPDFVFAQLSTDEESAKLRLLISCKHYLFARAHLLFFAEAAMIPSAMAGRSAATTSISPNMSAHCSFSQTEHHAPRNLHISLAMMKLTAGEDCMPNVLRASDIPHMGCREPYFEVLWVELVKQIFV